MNVFDYMNAVAEGVKSGIKIATPRWYPVTERLPEKNKRVLLCDRCTVFVGKLGNEGYWIFEPTEIGMCTKQSDILAWMPLPEPYEE